MLIPVLAHNVLHSSVALGLVGAALSLGAVVGTAVTTLLAPRLPRRATYAVGFFVAGAPRFVALALLASLPPVLAVIFVSGLGAGGINPVLGATAYERVSRHLQARVLGAVGASAWAGIPLGSGRKTDPDQAEGKRRPATGDRRQREASPVLGPCRLT